MQLIFVHGWSVTNTNTYGSLPQSVAAAASARGINLSVKHIHLGKYVSFHDEVTLDDIARALDQALRDLPGNSAKIAPFSCITHSTGGPVVRQWVEKFYGSSKLGESPLQHLVMLAPANHGSALAALGKQRVGRIKAWFSGVEPGQRVLDWLALGSEGQWDLNKAFLSYRPASKGYFPFVLTGQGIDTKFYDFLNAYLVEDGSDGVVRVAGANMNYRYLSLVQNSRPVPGAGKKTELEYNAKKPVKAPQTVPLGVFSEFSHSGNKMGIMAIKSKAANHKLIVDNVVDCLSVSTAADYKQVGQQLATLTQAEQAQKPVGKKNQIGRYAMLVFRVTDDAGNTINREDLDIYLLAGSSYRPDLLPQGFFVDKQMNKKSNSLVYYVDADVMSKIPDGNYGVRITARPEKGFSHYTTGEFRSQGIPIESVIAPNQTTYIDVVLKRNIDKNVFRFSQATNKPPKENFKKVRPSGNYVS